MVRGLLICKYKYYIIYSRWGEGRGGGLINAKEYSLYWFDPFKMADAKHAQKEQTYIYLSAHVFPTMSTEFGFFSQYRSNTIEHEIVR